MKKESTSTSAPSIVDIGCGNEKVSGAFGIDVIETPETDLVLDVDSEGLPWDDNTVDEIYAHMAFEHMNAPEIIRECHRVLKSNGVLHMKVPHPFTSGFWQDWTHEIQPGFTVDGINYLDPNHEMYYEHSLGSWEIKDLNIAFWLNLESLPGRGISAIASWIADLTSNKTREELLKLPFAGGWLSVDLSPIKINHTNNIMSN